MAVPTEAVLPGTLACSHHGGRWKVKTTVEMPDNGSQEGMAPISATPKDMTDPKFIQEGVANAGKVSQTIENYGGKLGISGFGVPLATIEMDGKEGKLSYIAGIKPNKPWQFAEYNKDYDNVWWDGLSGTWQNAVAPAHPDPVSGMHCWHQKVLLEPAQAGDKIGDIRVNYENNFKTYQAWRDTLSRGLDANSTMRRPRHIKRPWVELSDKAYKVDFKKDSKLWK